MRIAKQNTSFIWPDVFQPKLVGQPSQAGRRPPNLVPARDYLTNPVEGLDRSGAEKKGENGRSEAKQEFGCGLLLLQEESS